MNKINMSALIVICCVTVFFGSIACKKKATVNCSNGQLCIQNKAGKVVHYGWDTGGGQYTDSIMPNGSACKNVGQVEVSSTTSITPTTYFYSDRGNYAITVSTCNQTQIIN